MELKEFIKNTISQIGDAIQELNDCDNDIIINPVTREGINKVTFYQKPYNMTTINFHIEIAIDKSKSKNGQVGVLANVIGIGGKYENQDHSQNTTTIDFKLDVLFPQVKDR